MTSAIRFRLLPCEDNPQIHGYDEANFARRLFYAQRSIAPALAALKAAHDTTAQIIEHLSDSDWQRRARISPNVKVISPNGSASVAASASFAANGASVDETNVL